tara:strand:+ start:473 stop:685 length:213 start_codon:yes stop_codon:yes gene_type:complete
MSRLGDLTVVENTQPHWAAAKKYNHLRVEFPDGEEKSLLFTDSEIVNALKRADKNTEDLPEVSWIRDIFD